MTPTAGDRVQHPEIHGARWFTVLRATVRVGIGRGRARPRRGAYCRADNGDVYWFTDAQMGYED